MKIVTVVVALIVLVCGVVYASLPSQTQEYRSIDYKCLSDCTSAGYSYGYCKSLCSY